MKSEARESEPEPEQKVKKTQPIKKNKPPSVEVVRVRNTRAGGIEEKRKIPKYVMRKPLASNRFQRLRRFLENPGPRNCRSSINKPVQGKKR